MNLHHFLAIVRMRWQMAKNRFSKSSLSNRVFTTIFFALAAIGSLGIFLFAISGGNRLLTSVQPDNMVYVWDAVVVAFLFGWSMSLMIELQQSEMMSLKNLLHLPISLRGAFLLNYSSSLASLVLILFLPGMLGLCVASVNRFGFASLVVLALLFAFLFMVTAVTYQLRGYLSRLMENKRTRGTVIAVMTIFFVLLFQTPQLVTSRMIGNSETKQKLKTERDSQILDLTSKLSNREIDAAKFAQLNEKIEFDYHTKRAAESKKESDNLREKATVANAFLPIGWLPYGASAAAGGALLVPWLCVLGMTGIGLISLGLAYRSTVAVYTGQQNKSYRADGIKKTNAVIGGGMLEKKIPLLSDQQSAVALATLQSTIRASESKLALLTPLIFFFIFGFSAFNGKQESLPEMFRPFYAIAAIGIMLLGVAQLMLNMFGLDRQGFRAYVLSPLKRKDILIGKNIGLMPFATGLSVPLVIIVALIVKTQFTHVLATLCQCVIAQLLYFLIGNFTSIYATTGLAEGSMKPVEFSFKKMLFQLLAMLFVPLSMLPAVSSLGCELISETFGYTSGAPVYLILSLIELPVVILFYRWAVSKQGTWLQDEEQRILEVISKVAD